jgi:hypothetical protein
MIDLYIDLYYKKDVENKLQYHTFIYGQTEPLNGIEIIGSYSYFFKTGNAIIVKSDSIDSVKMRNGTLFLQETKITDKIKKFVVETI